MERSPVIMEWEQMGEKKASRQKLLRLLQLRLGQEMPSDVQQVIQQRQDLAILSGWFDQAVTVAGLDQVRHFLGLSNGGGHPS